MTVYIPDMIYEGSAKEIMEQLRDRTFTEDEYSDVRDYIRQMRLDFIRFTGTEFELPDGDADTMARTMITMLAREHALKVLDDG